VIGSMADVRLQRRTAPALDRAVFHDGQRIVLPIELGEGVDRLLDDEGIAGKLLQPHEQLLQHEVAVGLGLVRNALHDPVGTDEGVHVPAETLLTHVGIAGSPVPGRLAAVAHPAVHVVVPERSLEGLPHPERVLEHRDGVR